MPRVRDLPIASKMACASLAALVLLGLLTWSVLSTFATPQDLADQMQSASLAKWEARGAVAAEHAMRIQAERLRRESTGLGVESAAASVAVGAREVQGHLNLMRDPQTSDEVGQQASAALRDLAAALAHEAALRTAMLATRDASFLPSLPEFDAAFAGCATTSCRSRCCRWSATRSIASCGATRTRCRGRGATPWRSSHRVASPCSARWTRR